LTLNPVFSMAATQFVISHHGLVNATVPPTWVPGRRSEIAQSVGWEIREENGTWRVRTSEAYRQQAPRLLTSRLIGTGQFGLLSSLPLQADELTAGNQPMVSEALARVQQQDAVVAEIAEFQLTFLQTPTSQLPAALESLFVKLVARLPASELIVVDLAPELSARYTLAKLLLTADIAPDQLNQATLPTGQALATGGIFGAHLFIAPALLALAPYVFGVESARMRAAGVWLFGAAVAGLTWPSNQIIDAVRPLEGRFTGPRQREGRPPTVSADQLKAFFSWWVSQVNKVLSIATDPLNFVDTRTGEYDPAANWQYLASIERLFRDVAESLAATEGNETAQFRAAYDALDTLHGMRHRDFDDAVTPSIASKTLLRLKQDLAPDIAAVALPTCSRAVAALDQVKDGFTPLRPSTCAGTATAPTRSSTWRTGRRHCCSLTTAAFPEASPASPSSTSSIWWPIRISCKPSCDRSCGLPDRLHRHRDGQPVGPQPDKAREGARTRSTPEGPSARLRQLRAGSGHGIG
jgi:hypothetical protein